MKRENSIVQVLKNGTSASDGHFTTVRSGNFTAKFWNNSDLQTFANKQKKIDRQIKNKCEFGHVSGYSGINKENKTAKELAEVIKSSQDCRRYFRIAVEAMKAPKKLQKYVFANLIEKCKKQDIYYLNQKCSFYTAQILPKAYTKGWENETVLGYEYSYIVEDLTPAYGCPIGAQVSFVKDGEKMTGEIVGYFYNNIKRYSRRSWYGETVHEVRGEYELFYVVMYGPHKYDKVSLKREYFKVKMAKAV